MKFAGACHCGAIRLEFVTGIAPAELDLRACQCSFCRKHNAIAVSDPNGQLVVRVLQPSALSSYEFGLRTATYLVCNRCGVYVAAVTTDAPSRGIAILGALDDAGRFSRPVRRVDFDRESRAERIARRRRTWTPASVIVTQTN